jgi:sulfate transport system permease protein
VSIAQARRRVLPGFGLSLAVTCTYLALLIVVPLGALIARAATSTGSSFVAAVLSQRALASYKLTFGASCAAALVDSGAGLVIAWVLARYRFPGRSLLDAAVDVPFALPTVVAGLTLAALYAPGGPLGRFLAPIGLRVAFTRIGVIVALAFVGLPFAVRTVQPVIQDLSRDSEEAAAVLGASPLQTFRRVVLPALAPSLITGFALSFARAVGEYGSVVFISGNLPFRTEIAPLLVVTRLEQYDYQGASAIAVFLLFVSFVLLLAVSILQAWLLRRAGTEPGR